MDEDELQDELVSNLKQLSMTYFEKSRVYSSLAQKVERGQISVEEFFETAEDYGVFTENRL